MTCTGLDRQILAYLTNSKHVKKMQLLKHQIKGVVISTKFCLFTESHQFLITF